MLRIFLIEDNPADVMLVREALDRSWVAHELMVAHDGEQALRMLDDLRSEPHLILLDLNVPKLDGLALLQRSDRLGAPVIVLTGSENPEDKSRALALGARDYVVKPLKFDDFVETIRRMLDRWQKAE